MNEWKKMKQSDAREKEIIFTKPLSFVLPSSLFLSSLLLSSPTSLSQRLLLWHYERNRKLWFFLVEKKNQKQNKDESVTKCCFQIKFNVNTLNGRLWGIYPPPDYCVVARTLWCTIASQLKDKYVDLVWIVGVTQCWCHSQTNQYLWCRESMFGHSRLFVSMHFGKIIFSLSNSAVVRTFSKIQTNTNERARRFYWNTEIGERN